jgi:WhiB family redox-sensing transcriptional regulator
LLGACREVDGSLFFGPEQESRSARAIRLSAAKRVCARCPVLERCRTYALENEERYGVWGGLAEEERRALTGQA